MRNPVERGLWYTYIASLPLSNALAITPTVTIPVALSLALGVVVLLGFRYPARVAWSVVEPPLFLFGGVIITSLALNSGELDGRALGHTLSWLVCLGFMYYVPRLCLSRYGVRSALSAVTVLFFLVAAYVTVEWTVKNIFLFDFDSLIPRPQGRQYFANALVIFQRARGFASESGLAGLFFATLMPIVHIHLSERSTSALAKGVFVSSIILTGLFIFSTTYFIAMALYAVARFASAHRSWAKYALVGVAVAAFVGFRDELGQLAYVLVLSKFEMSSADIRFSNLSESLTVITRSGLSHVALGYGPGSYDRLGLGDAAPSVFANVFRDLGLFGLGAFLLLFLAVFSQIATAPKRRRVDLAASLVIILLFMQSNMEYYQPIIWFVWAIIWGLSRHGDDSEASEPVRVSMDRPGAPLVPA